MSTKKTTTLQPMTRSRFLEELDRTRTTIDWQRINSNIRGTAKGYDFCPVTAVCYCLTGTVHLPRFWDKAADEIGLGRFLASEIVNAADRAEAVGSEQIRERAIRDELLTTLHLEEAQ
jgi:hypothetical protein